MVWGMKDGGRQHKYYAIISACSYTWVGMSNLLSQRGIYPIRVMHATEELSGEEQEIIDEGEQTQLIVFLQGDLCTILLSLKKLILWLEHSSARSDVTIFSRLPACWLYGTLHSLLRNKNKLRDVRFGSSSDPCQSLTYGHYPLIEFAAREDAGPGFCCANGLSFRELNAVLHYYQGQSVKSQSLHTGLAGKTIYTHRQHGLKKLLGVQQWLNDAAVTREMNRRRHECGQHAVAVSASR
ncbi:hypothetical protein [Pluralibacter gergoviae]|nr:hypothetical protein [Pluralibacter gergoviae]EKV6247883.1 hypothetical protein [Pluralibacter gergoviae]EKW9964641.1 hypothetical protein [Pluralibacter gergoviae]ELD4269765.1 hypothetical protein [Pluralibacter gergoviae]ELD4275969.1 hypothetical protein [Pluralibacter gergoviae]